MRIRPARPDDHDQWLPLWRGYQSFYKVDLPPEQSALNWQRFLDPAEPVFCAVAEDDSAQGGGRLVGMVHYLYHRSCWTAGDYCYLQDLFAAPDCRGRGVGRALIEHVYTAAEAGGASRVWWLTHETNSDAMLLYDRIAARSGFLQYRKLLG